MSVKTRAYISECTKKLDRTADSGLIAAFLESSEKHGDAEAYACLGQAISFREVERLSRNFAAYLVHECQLVKGDRIAIQLPNLVQYPIVAWGALRAGLTIVNTNPLYTNRELEYQFNDSGAKALVVFSDNLQRIGEIIEKTSVTTVIATHAMDMLAPQALPETAMDQVIPLLDALEAGERLELPEIDIDIDDLALLQYTGGTTGSPKGAMLSHGNVLSACLMSPLSFGADMTLREMGIAPMPMYHIYGFIVNLISGFLSGGYAVLIPNPRDLDALIQAMKAYPFTAFAGVNTLFTALMQHPEFDTIDFSHLRWTISGGATTVPEVANEWQARTGALIHEGYGLSETAAMATVNSLTSHELGTIGPAMVGTELKVVNPDGEQLPNGDEGELLIRGPQVMKGYWQRDEATAEAIDADGWFRTGDIAVIQDDGHVRIVDRLKDMVLVSGFNVYPNEIEGVVYGHPGVIECAVVGVPDDKSGEAVKLFAVLSDPNVSGDELREFCRKELAAYKVPKYVEFKDELPKSNVGKVLRRELRG